MGNFHELNLEELLNEHGDELFRFAFRRVGKRELAEDLVQEAFLIAFEKRELYRGEGSPIGWLKTILKNKILDLVRSRSFQESPTDFTTEFNEWGIWREPFSKCFEWRPTPLESVERMNFLEILEDCLSRLPLKQRAVIALRAFEERTTEEICKELEISPSNEWVLTYRARLSLRTCLEKNWQKA